MLWASSLIWNIWYKRSLPTSSWYFSFSNQTPESPFSSTPQNRNLIFISMKLCWKKKKNNHVYFFTFICLMLTASKLSRLLEWQICLSSHFPQKTELRYAHIWYYQIDENEWIIEENEVTILSLLCLGFPSC